MSTAEANTPDIVAIFAALGDTTRLAVVERLADGKARSIATLAAATALSRQAVTRHLRVLERAGLVRQQPAGRERRYTFSPDALDAAKMRLERVSREWDDALMRLRDHVER